MFPFSLVFRLNKHLSTLFINNCIVNFTGVIISAVLPVDAKWGQSTMLVTVDQVRLLSVMGSI